MKKLIPIFSLISFLCFAGNVLAEGSSATKCDPSTIEELKAERDSLRDEGDYIERELLVVKREIRKCDKEKRTEEFLNEARTKKPM